MKNTIMPRTVKLIGRIMKPFVDEGIIPVSEEQEILRNLKHLASRGELSPTIVPKLLTREEAANMLAISVPNFKKQEREGAFPFCKKLVGSSPRYRNTDIIDFIMAD